MLKYYKSEEQSGGVEEYDELLAALPEIAS